jgi:hypothetical protein
MGEIKRQDIIDDDAVMAPLVIQKNFESLLGTMKLVISAGKEHSKVIGGSTTTTQLKDETHKLTLEQKELIKVQNQIATAVAKNNDEYRKYEKELQNVKKELKEKNSLTAEEALLITKQNAAIDKLGQALTKNRQAYSALRTESERNTKQGQNLLKVIQQQDKEFKQLKQSMGQFQDEVGNYQNALQGLDGVTGGLIGRLKGLGQQFGAIFSNGYVLAIGAIVGAFMLLKSAVTTYFDTTVEGEEKLKSQQATWEAFFITLRNGWASVGKSVFEFFGENGLKGAFTALLTYISPAMAAEFLATEVNAQKLSAALAKLWKDHIRDVVDDAKTEVKVNQDLEDSKNKLKFTDEERITALRQANKLLSEQLQGDIDLANADIKAQQLRIEELGGVIIKGKLISELSDDEIKSMHVKQEEVEKLGQLQAAALKIESDASLKRKANLKAEIALVQEMAREEKAFQDELVKMAKDAVESKVQDSKNAESKLITDEQERALKSLKNTDLTEIDRRGIIDRSQKNIEYIKKESSKRLIEDEITALTESLGLLKLNAEEKAAVEQKIFELKGRLTQLAYDAEIANSKKSLADVQKTLNNVNTEYNKFIGSITSLFSSFTTTRLNDIDKEEAHFNAATDRKLKLAGDNEAEKLKIEADANKKRDEFEKQRIKEQRRAAIFDKFTAAVQAGINTGLAVTNQLAKGDPYTAFARALAAGTAGALQVAAILAKPIPQYELGTRGTPHKGGLAVVGEKGSEMMFTPNGVQLTPAFPTLMNLPAGTEVIPHDETMRMIAMSGMGDLSGNNKTVVNLDDRRIVQAIKDQKPAAVPDLARIGSDIYDVKIYKDGSKKYIRNKSIN